MIEILFGVNAKIMINGCMGFTLNESEIMRDLKPKNRLISNMKLGMKVLLLMKSPLKLLVNLLG